MWQCYTSNTTLNRQHKHYATGHQTLPCVVFNAKQTYDVNNNTFFMKSSTNVHNFVIKIKHTSSIKRSMTKTPYRRSNASPMSLERRSTVVITSKQRQMSHQIHSNFTLLSHYHYSNFPSLFIDVTPMSLQRPSSLQRSKVTPAWLSSSVTPMSHSCSFRRWTLSQCYKKHPFP